MNLLIDTQSIIWFAENNSLLSKKARTAIEKPENICYISMASLWEMSIKINLGKLSIKGLTLEAFISELMSNDFPILDITKIHIIENGNLPLHHRDPFDRLIIAQAIVEDWPIVSSDDAFDGYDIERVW